MIRFNYSPELRATIAAAHLEALRLARRDMQPLDLLHGLLEGPQDAVASQVLSTAGVDVASLRDELARVSVDARRATPLPDDAVPLSIAAKRLLDAASAEAGGLGHEQAGPAHLLIAMLLLSSGSAADRVAERETVVRRARERTRALMGGAGD